jgi:hypothetical protein
MLVLLAFIDGEREKSCGFCATVVRHKRVPLVGERRENRRVGQQDAIVHADRDAALTGQLGGGPVPEDVVLLHGDAADEDNDRH